MTSRGKFWGFTGGTGKIFGGSDPPGTPLALPLGGRMARGPNAVR